MSSAKKEAPVAQMADALKANKQPSQEELERAAVEMLAQQPTSEDGDAMQRLCSLVIVDLNNKEIHIKTVVYEMVFELREFLAEHVYTCFFTNFYFEHAGQRLNEYTELSELDLASNNRIVMRPDKYDERSARTHIKRLIDILEKPPVLTLVTSGGPEEASNAVAPRSRSASHASQNKADQEEDKKEAEAPLNDADEKLKKNYEEFYQVIQAHQNDEATLLQSKDDLTAAQKVASNVTDLLQGSIYKSDLNKLKHVACIESIELSTYNPVPEVRKMAGDILYLTVRTLENPSYEYGITCSVNGFYRNDSSERVSFSPLPSARNNPCFSYSLAGCLNQLSGAFSRNLQTYLSSILKCEPYFISPITQQQNSEHWLTTAEKAIHVSNFEGVSQTAHPLHGFDPKQVRDWNEEFQVVRTFPTDTYLLRVQKDRASIKVYQDFVEAAVKGAKAIIESKITSLNPNEPVKQHVYVYNQIFFSYAVDTPLSYRDCTSTEQFPSYTQANHDMKGLELLKGIEIPDLHHLATCLVDFKGSRMICQSIIPGILNNSDLSSLAEYGTVDDKKSIVVTDQFHEKMLKVAEALNIKVNKVIDPTDGKSVEIAGSIEIKGIKGSDRRNYVVDLQGLVPRDANYEGDDFHTCLVRPELIPLFQRAQSMEYASDRIKEFASKLDEERKAGEPKAEEGKELSDEQKKDIQARRQEDNLKKLREVERLVKEAPKFTFNTNVFKTNVKLDMSADELAKEQANVKKLASFITDKAIPNLVQDLKQQEGVPIDSSTLTDFLHKRGVNMRYLGRILAAVDSVPEITASEDKNLTIHQLQMMGEYKHVKGMLEREIFLRSAKHVLNRILKEESGESDLHLAQIVAHCLNCVLAPLPFIQAMNSGKLKPVDEAIQNQFSFLPEEAVQTKPRANSMSVAAEDASPSKTAPAAKPEPTAAASQPSEAATLSKKQLKRQKQKVNKMQSKEQQAQVSTKDAKQTEGKTSMSEILFKQNESQLSQEEFKVDDLFAQPNLANGLHRLLPPSALSLTPREIYEEVKAVAKVKFGHELPAEQKKLQCLQSAVFKTALMRDLCKILGVQLSLDTQSEKKLILGNKIKPIVACLNAQLQAELLVANNNLAKRKKQALTNAQALTEADVLADYKYLPFQASDIGKLYASVKQISHYQADVRACIAQANQFHKENQLDKAFELYSQGINMLLQVSGAMSEEVATCIANIASIQFKFGDFLQAIELQTKAIVLQERLLGVDHPQVGHSYATLSMYYHNCGYFAKGCEYLHRALSVLQSSVGEYHPEIASLYLKMGLVYQETDNIDAALEAYQYHLDQTKTMFGEDHIQTASSHQAIALCQYRRQDFRKALESQEQAHTVLKKLLAETNPIVTAAKQQFDLYLKLSVQYEQQKSVISRAIGENKQKVDPRLLQAIVEARKQRESQQQEAGKKGAAESVAVDSEAKQQEPEASSGPASEQQKQAVEAFQRYQGLVKKLQNPKSKRDFLDLLEFQHIRENQDKYSKALIEAAAAQKAAKEEDKKKPE